MRRHRAVAPPSAASRPARVLAGENHGLVGFLSHDLGRVRREQRDWREARRWFERAVAVRKATEEAAPLAESLAQLGSVCRASNDLAAAAAAMEECVSLSETLPREQCSPVALVSRRWQLTQYLLELGRGDAAEATQRDGLAAARRAAASAPARQPGVDAPQLASWTLARTLRRLHKDGEAAEIFGACIEEKAAQLGRRHPALRPMLAEYRQALAACPAMHADAARAERWLAELAAGKG